MKTKSLGNTTSNGASKNVPDLQIWGDGDMFKLLCKASSKEEGWMKSTKAMEIEGVGCVVQVTTHQLNDTGLWPIAKTGESIDYSNPENTIKHSVISESVAFIPGVRIHETMNDSGEVILRRLVCLNYNSEGEDKVGN